MDILLKSLSLYVPEVLKRHPFWMEPSCIGHYSKCCPLPLTPPPPPLTMGCQPYL